MSRTGTGGEESPHSPPALSSPSLPHPEAGRSGPRGVSASGAPRPRDRAPIWHRGVLCVLAVAAIFVLAGFWGFSYDDAFITYRYALNLQEEGRLAYGPGGPTYGTSAPGYAALLGGLGHLGAPIGLSIPGWGSLLGIAGLLSLSLVVLFWERRDAEAPVDPGSAAPISWLVPAALLLLGLRWNVEMLGAETLPAMGMVALAAWLLFARDRETAAGLALAGAALFRLDAALAALAFGLVRWVARRSFPWRLALAGTVPVGLYLAWLALHFGQLVPDTLHGKQAEMAFATASMTRSQWLWLVRSVGTPGAAVLLGLAGAGAVWLVARGELRRPVLAAVALWLLGHELIYRLLAVPFAPWYHVATLAVLVLLAAFGAARSISWLLARLPGRFTRPGIPLAATLVLLLPILLPTASWLIDSWGTPPDPRWEVYHGVGHHLRAVSAPGDTVAAVEIGFLGYSSRRPLLDLMGLVSPEVVEARQRGRLPELVAERRPRYLLDVPLFREPTLGAILAHPVIRRCYGESAVFPAPDWMGGRVILLERREITACS